MCYVFLLNVLLECFSKTTHYIAVISFIVYELWEAIYLLFVLPNMVVQERRAKVFNRTATTCGMVRNP